MAITYSIRFKNLITYSYLLEKRDKPAICFWWQANNTNLSGNYINLSNELVVVYLLHLQFLRWKYLVNLSLKMNNLKFAQANWKNCERAIFWNLSLPTQINIARFRHELPLGKLLPLKNGTPRINKKRAIFKDCT